MRTLASSCLWHKNHKFGNLKQQKFIFLVLDVRVYSQAVGIGSFCRCPMPLATYPYDWQSLGFPWLTFLPLPSYHYLLCPCRTACRAMLVQHNLFLIMSSKTLFSKGYMFSDWGLDLIILQDTVQPIPRTTLVFSGDLMGKDLFLIFEGTSLSSTYKFKPAILLGAFRPQDDIFRQQLMCTKYQPLVWVPLLRSMVTHSTSFRFSLIYFFYCCFILVWQKVKKFSGLVIKYFFMNKRYSKDTELLKQQDALPLGVWQQKCLFAHIENVCYCYGSGMAVR